MIIQNAQSQYRESQIRHEACWQLIYLDDHHSHFEIPILWRHIMYVNVLFLSIQNIY